CTRRRRPPAASAPPSTSPGTWPPTRRSSHPRRPAPGSLGHLAAALASRLATPVADHVVEDAAVVEQRLAEQLRVPPAFVHRQPAARVFGAARQGVVISGMPAVAQRRHDEPVRLPHGLLWRVKEPGFDAIPRQHVPVTRLLRERYQAG